ncbi:YqiJ family protein [Pelagibius litoralis]|uniref:YqiJ family protein n=1 Tax=Pelagibius litoralis TaxID=374515 RepID=A0A967KBK2_9PROT|nr:OB-fold-containig protein [Pelagibius litoralis]NIA72208.1 YqiJ family protein [Pelagibius litoralis]
MTSVGFFFADQNSPFLATAVITLVIAAVEILSVLLGLGLSDLVDDVLPDIGPGTSADIDAETPEAEGTILGDALSWLNVGRVPFLVLLLTFLTVFTVGGYALQMLVGGTLGFYLPSLLAAPAALAAAIPVTRWTSRGLGRVVPREETYATGNEDLIGRIATISLGPVTRRAAGKAKVADQHGNLHFVRVRAANRGETFQTDAAVLLVGHKRSLFEVITPPSSLSSSHSQNGD